MPTMRHKPTVQKMTKSLQHAKNTTALAFRGRYDFRLREKKRVGIINRRIFGQFNMNASVLFCWLNGKMALRQ